MNTAKPDKAPKAKRRKPRAPSAPQPPSKLKLRMSELGVTVKQLLQELRAAIPEAAYTPMQPLRWGQGQPVRTPVAAWLAQRLQVAGPEELGLVMRGCPSEHPLVAWLWTNTGGDWPPGVEAWARRLEISVDHLNSLRSGWQRKSRRHRSATLRQDLVERLIALGAPDPGELEINGMRVPWRTLCADW